ncbi:BOI-related E3 ubiquitin-protein ligase 1-like [Curcuma longa]|uniref:BOI-related E3 ubiquitin-protein ligase 1-like n=1 Tax=Curcuma longa TaxID=136217 RepID=UPI003D9F310B
MAVQTIGFSSEFGARGMDELQMLQQDPRQVSSNLGIGKQQQPQIRTDPSMFCERKREQTCNVSAPAKRPRAESVALSGYNLVATSPFCPYLDQTANAPVKLAGTIPGFLPQSRLPESCATSTSGRHASSLQPVSASFGNLVSLLYQQNLEIDAFVRFQNERLLSELKEMRTRHCQAFLSSLPKQAEKSLMEKEAELQSAARRNSELEEKVRQLSEENRFWFNMAKNNEAVASNLRSSLEQALLRGGASYGNGEVAADVVLDTDDVESCCEAENSVADAPHGKSCKACGVRDVSVLLLPCRHLCLCEDCEPGADGCPLCGATKKNSFRVLMC